MLTYLLYKIGQALALILPVKLTYRIAERLGDIKRIFSPRDRNDLRVNFYHIFSPDDPRIDRYVRDVYRNFAKYLVDFFRFSKIDRKFIERNVKVENIHYLDEGLAKNKGAIVVTAHLGNWELGGAVAALLGYPLMAVTLVHKDKRVNGFFQSQRRRMGIEVIQLTSALRRCFDGLGENKVLALVGDRDFTNHGITTNFLGKSMKIPKGPAALSLTTGAPIVPGFLLREKDDKFRFVFEKPIEYTPTDKPQNDILNLTNMYLKVLERYIKNYPEQWYLFRKFWEVPVW